MERNCICFDMDGTLADFYSVQGWLNDLQNENPRPYRIAKPLLNMEKLSSLLKSLQENFDIIIISWLSRGSSKNFDILTRSIKKEWLKEYNFPADSLHLVKYRTLKQSTLRGKYKKAILFDDDINIREKWNSPTRSRYSFAPCQILGILEEIAKNGSEKFFKKISKKGLTN